MFKNEFLQFYVKNFRRYVLEEYCGSQRSELVRGFIDAMTRAEDGKKPIEMQAHDPPRYVGDMLAWVHQNVPSEIEALDNLLAKCKNVEAAGDSGKVPLFFLDPKH